VSQPEAADAGQAISSATLGGRRVVPPDVIIEHFPQDLLALKGIACEVKFNRPADRADTIEEFVFGLRVGY
jgi:hypothetical protein